MKKITQAYKRSYVTSSKPFVNIKKGQISKDLLRSNTSRSCNPNMKEQSEQSTLPERKHFSLQLGGIFAHAYIRSEIQSLRHLYIKKQQKCSNREHLLRGKTFKKLQTSVDGDSYGASQPADSRKTSRHYCHPMLLRTGDSGRGVHKRHLHRSSQEGHSSKLARKSVHSPGLNTLIKPEEDGVKLTTDEQDAFAAHVRRWKGWGLTAATPD